MSGLLLDTNILIDVLRDLPQAVRYLESIRGDIAISALSVAELHAGARDERERRLIREFTSAFDVISADGTMCENGGEFRARYGPSHGVDLIDGIIAATSLVCERTLVTLNKKHFPMLQNVAVPYRRQA